MNIILNREIKEPEKLEKSFMEPPLSPQQVHPSPVVSENGSNDNRINSRQDSHHADNVIETPSDQPPKRVMQLDESKIEEVNVDLGADSDGMDWDF